MGIFNSLESRFRWLAFPGFLRGLSIIHFVVALAVWMRPDIAQALIFDWEKVLGGEVWRLFSFLFLVSNPPPDAPPFESIWTLLWALIALRIGFLLSDALENAWGVFRTSLFLFGLIAGQIVANLALANLGLPTIPDGGTYLYLGAFFAFASLFPKFSFLLFFIIPVPVWVFAAFAGFFLMLTAFNSASFAIFIPLAFAPYLGWAIPNALNYSKTRGEVARRRMDFQSKSKSNSSENFHHCAECKATESSHPDREFRVTEDGREICSECLKNLMQSEP
jgi:hypothetical protein